MSRRDPVQDAVERIVRELVAGAYPRTPILAWVCACGHEDGAHHGRDGELECADCGCEVFVLERELVLA